MTDTTPKQGAALHAALSLRGVDVSLAEAAGLSDLLLELASLGLLVPGHKAVHGDAIGPEPSSDAKPLDPVGIGRGARFGGCGRVALAEGGAVGRRKGPIVTNRGPSIHQNPGDAA